jgi:hypothetical protein
MHSSAVAIVNQRRELAFMEIINGALKWSMRVKHRAQQSLGAPHSSRLNP